MAYLIFCIVKEPAVVPMRYGCFLNGMKAIRNALKERRRQYETLLVQLEGHVEMGIRILLSEKEWRPRQAETMKGRDALSTAETAAPGRPIIFSYKMVL
jgi:hypothetical protein